MTVVSTIMIEAIINMDLMEKFHETMGQQRRFSKANVSAKDGKGSPC